MLHCAFKGTACFIKERGNVLIWLAPNGHGHHPRNSETHTSPEMSRAFARRLWSTNTSPEVPGQSPTRYDIATPSTSTHMLDSLSDNFNIYSAVRLFSATHRYGWQSLWSCIRFEHIFSSVTNIHHYICCTSWRFPTYRKRITWIVLLNDGRRENSNQASQSGRLEHTGGSLQVQVIHEVSVWL